MGNGIFALYIIENQLNGKVYVGITHNPKQRWYTHRSHARGKSRMHIHRAMRKYGLENFVFQPCIYYGSRTEAQLDEMFWVAELRRLLGHDRVYNESNGGEGQPGSLSEATKEKLRQFNLGKKMSIETKTKMSLARKGKSHHWAPQSGKPHSDETKAKIREANIGKNLGKKASEETRKKMSEAQLLRRSRI